VERGPVPGQAAMPSSVRAACAEARRAGWWRKRGKSWPWTPPTWAGKRCAGLIT